MKLSPQEAERDLSVLYGLTAFSVRLLDTEWLRWVGRLSASVVMKRSMRSSRALFQEVVFCSLVAAIN